MPNVRSGHHRELIVNTWYRRVVPPDVRDVFGVTKVKKSLGTSSETEAKRLEKIHDVEFEERLRQARGARPDGHPRDDDARVGQFVNEIFTREEASPAKLERALKRYPREDRQA